ncbi:hypothetical protein [Thermogladius sp.]|uniref:hypothetical protein n=1 Tax=Thermogladius sp. TaxID=2023064 RepID=UPI003D096FF0
MSEQTIEEKCQELLKEENLRLLGAEKSRDKEKGDVVFKPVTTLVAYTLGFLSLYATMPTSEDGSSLLLTEAERKFWEKLNPGDVTRIALYITLKTLYPNADRECLDSLAYSLYRVMVDAWPDIAVDVNAASGLIREYALGLAGRDAVLSQLGRLIGKIMMRTAVLEYKYLHAEDKSGKQ